MGLLSSTASPAGVIRENISQSSYWKLKIGSVTNVIQGIHGILIACPHAFCLFCPYTTDLMIHLLIPLAPPGSGKNPGQTGFEHYGLTHISTGDLFHMKWRTHFARPESQSLYG